jgi:hypothetical protein
MIMYYTFGDGQELQGCVLPIVCDEMAQADGYMRNRFGNKWALTYTERAWAAYKVRARENSAEYLIEQTLPVVNLRSK